MLCYKTASNAPLPLTPEGQDLICVRDGVLNNSFTFGVSEDVCISKPMNVNLPRLPGVPGFLPLWQRRGTTAPATHGTLGHSEDANTKKQTCSVQCD